MAQKSLNEIVMDYSFNENDVNKWVPLGGDIIKYVGSDVVKILFTRDTVDSPWRSNSKAVKIVSVFNYDPITRSYEMTYTEGDEEKTERIIPEGFSLSNPEMDLTVSRYIPLSTHYRKSEDSILYSRLKKSFDTAPTLSKTDIVRFYGSDQEESIGRDSHVAAVIKTPDDNILYFRVMKIAFSTDPTKKKEDPDKAVFSVTDKNGLTHKVVLDRKEGGVWEMDKFSIYGQVVGKLKMFNLLFI